ncbi:hypothetical protein DPEC_G00036780 [Dallia pectoralis]|uniref:Uncharacterized protein n=1 Tax=Dallia pectoralis TaxID=75939 RepID=A0ACC2HE28_DALPE|nr:hypothetical protein DPEC_G00036780 [Dallia pectoralis]
MASSFSSSSFCRASTAMMIFLSSSVRWLRSGSGTDAGTTGGRGPPRGPTEADIFSPPSPPRLGSRTEIPLAAPTDHDMAHGRSDGSGSPPLPSTSSYREPISPAENSILGAASLSCFSANSGSSAGCRAPCYPQMRRSTR